MMLRNRRDLQSLLYLVSLPMLVFYLWRREIDSALACLVYGLVILLSVGVGAVHHQHAHLRMWRNKWLNRYTDLYISMLQGHPSFVFFSAHNANHHRYHHGPKDVARTYRFGGDTNHFFGFVLHPFHAVLVLYPFFARWLRRLQVRHAKVFVFYMLQYGVVLLTWVVLATQDWQKFLLLILAPQLLGLHWLLAINYLQHAHADGNSPINFARNFDGWVNLLYFNIGMHTAHHRHPRVHWSKLPTLQREYQKQVDPRLNAGSLFRYVLRTFFLSVFWSPWRSHSLMKNPSPLQKENECPVNSTTFT